MQWNLIWKESLLTVSSLLRGTPDEHSSANIFVSNHRDAFLGDLSVIWWCERIHPRASLWAPNNTPRSNSAERAIPSEYFMLSFSASSVFSLWAQRDKGARWNGLYWLSTEKASRGRRRCQHLSPIIAVPNSPVVAPVLCQATKLTLRKGLVVRNNLLWLNEAFISLWSCLCAVNVKVRAEGETVTPAGLSPFIMGIGHDDCHSGLLL